MAITATTGATVNNASAGTSLTFAATSLTTGQDVVIAVAILDTTVSVNSITDTASNAYTLKSAVNNGTSVRVEIWACHSITGNASDVIVVNLSGSSLASAAFEEYAGATSGIGSIGATRTGTGTYAEGNVVSQDANNWSIAAIAVASSSGDTFTASLGTIRRSLIPALTTAAVALVDNTAAPLVTLRDLVQISTSRAWAATCIELRTGATPIRFVAPNINPPIRRAPLVAVSGGGESSYAFIS